eukprot:1409324-Rhodomonas_salina.2
MPTKYGQGSPAGVRRYKVEDRSFCNQQRRRIASSLDHGPADMYDTPIEWARNSIEYAILDSEQCL